MTKDLKELTSRAYDYGFSFASAPAIKIIGIETAVLTQAVTDMRFDLLLLLVLTGADFITAVVAAMKSEKFCSLGMRQTVLKLSIYILLVFLGHLTHLIAKIDWAQSAFMGLIVSTEIVSILENIELINPGMLPRKILGRFGITLKKAKR